MCAEHFCDSEGAAVELDRDYACVFAGCAGVQEPAAGAMHRCDVAAQDGADRIDAMNTEINSKPTTGFDAVLPSANFDVVGLIAVRDDGSAEIAPMDLICNRPKGRGESPHGTSEQGSTVPACGVHDSAGIGVGCSELFVHKRRDAAFQERQRRRCVFRGDRGDQRAVNIVPLHFFEGSNSLCSESACVLVCPRRLAVDDVRNPDAHPPEDRGKGVGVADIQTDDCQIHCTPFVITRTGFMDCMGIDRIIFAGIKLSNRQSKNMKQSKVSIRKVASAAGVSRSTVSLVLNNSAGPHPETREKVLQAVRDLDYQPDPAYRRAFQRRTLVDGAPLTDTIGFLTSEDIFLAAQNRDGYYSRVHAGIQRAIGQHDYHLMWKSADAGSTALPRMVADNRIDALLIEGDFPDLLLEILVRRLPVVFIDRTHPRLRADSVMPNVEKAVAEQLDMLWELGHRNIITFQQQLPVLHVDLYLRAFHGFFAARGHAVVHPKLCERQAIDPSSHEQVMAEYARRIASADPRPTAVMTWDVYACALMAEFQRQGMRVPQDISVIGMDDTVAATFASPPLTSYRFPMEEMGQCAVELAIQRIRDSARASRHMLVDGQRSNRSSCAPL